MKLGEKKMKKEWEELERKVIEALKETEKELGGMEKRKTGWWDRECKEKKREVRRELRK